MEIRRALLPSVEERLFKGKVITVVGARQVGKSTLFRHIIEQYGSDDVLQLNCDDPEVRALLSEIPAPRMKMLVGQNRMVVIDEAQRVEGIGLTLKRMVEAFPDVQILVTGSSSIGIHGNLNEPLTGRKYEYELFPVSTAEVISSYGLHGAAQQLAQRLIYGSYPEIVTKPEDAVELLTQLSDSYLYKDLLEFEGIRKPALLSKLLTALALQVGSEVSYSEVAQTVGSDPKTVEKYVDLLEKCYVVFRLDGLSRNLRNELKRNKKIYFYDNGIRNALLRNYAPMELRTDAGALWENFFIIERMKFNAYRGHHAKYYFWRTRTQQEIDLVEEYNGTFSVFEMKWNPRRAGADIPSAFLTAYNPVSVNVVTPDNYIDFLV